MTIAWFLLILALMGGVWFILDTARARDAARHHAGRYCRELGVQFLDQTVALASTRLVRRPGGSLWLQRGFRFEFSETGNDRWPGEISVLAGVATHIVLDGDRIGRVVGGTRNDSE